MKKAYALLCGFFFRTQQIQNQNLTLLHRPRTLYLVAVKYGSVVSSCIILDTAGSMCDYGQELVCERLLHGGLQ